MSTLNMATGMDMDKNTDTDKVTVTYMDKNRDTNMETDMDTVTYMDKVMYKVMDMDMAMGRTWA
jgi:hypothetical protein